VAITQWERVGNIAQGRNSFKEAEESYRQASAMLNLLPESPERDLRELHLRQSLASMLQVTKGWAAAETVDVVERLAAVAAKTGNLKELGNSLAGRAFTAWIQGELSTAGALADQALELALREPNPGILALRYMLQIIVRFWRSDFAGADEHFTMGRKCFDDPGFRSSPTGAPIAVFAYASYSAWMLGRAEVARQRLAAMNAAVHESNPHDVAFAAIHGGMVLLSLREYERAEVLGAQALKVSEKERFPNEAAMARWLLGSARAQLGRTAEGSELIRQAMADLAGVGQRIGITSRFGCLAEALERQAVIPDAVEAAEQALESNPEELAYRPEAFRLRGELQLKRGQPSAAEADFYEAISLAGKARAKVWELRATMSLARLLRDSGRRDEAHAMLAEIYNWFTDGFDTPDLRDAKALLDELAA
jgi:tetratricopeptide (TPR) repeat protein